MRFGEYIKKIREQKSMTLEELSEKSGVSVSQISRIESGKRGVPKPTTIKKLATGLGVSYTELMIVAGHWEEDDLNPKGLNKTLNPASTPEARFEKKLIELSDSELLERFTLTLDGRELSPEEAKGVIAYLRSLRQI